MKGSYLFKYLLKDSMRGSKKFCHWGPNFDNFFFCFFLVDEGREDQCTTISGPSSARQQNAI